MGEDTQNRGGTPAEEWIPEHGDCGFRSSVTDLGGIDSSGVLELRPIKDDRGWATGCTTRPFARPG
jgi:hypothetical protein